MKEAATSSLQRRRPTEVAGGDMPCTRSHEKSMATPGSKHRSPESQSEAYHKASPTTEACASTAKHRGEVLHAPFCNATLCYGRLVIWQGKEKKPNDCPTKSECFGAVLCASPRILGPNRYMR